ncbi:hypothetical protein STRCR_1503 [Streptococcus criceti HS-6]|uniref:Uncharacterized protein n=1 Tax=Streptococcus criceti HS-6 TaxID=873449 RepID=G5JNX2_STRCG|nr:hypothetical protein STRCR_1503 [Streptococcus criceti HS-6]
MHRDWQKNSQAQDKDEHFDNHIMDHSLVVYNSKLLSPFNAEAGKKYSSLLLLQ